MNLCPRALAASLLPLSMLALLPAAASAEPQNLDAFLDQRLYGQAGAPENAGDRQRQKAIFARLDLDGSGTLDDAEQQGLHWVDVVEPLARLGLHAAVVTTAEGHEPRTGAQRLMLGIALVQRDRAHALNKLRSGMPWADDDDLAVVLERARTLLAAVAADDAELRPAADAYLQAVTYLEAENRSLAAQKDAFRPRDASQALVGEEIEKLWNRDQGTNLEQAILNEVREQKEDIKGLVEDIDAAAQAIAQRAGEVDGVDNALSQAENDLNAVWIEDSNLARALSERLKDWDARKELLLDAHREELPENPLQQFRYVFTHLQTLQESDAANRRFLEWLAEKPQEGALRALLEFLLDRNPGDNELVLEMVELLDSLPPEGDGDGGGR